MPTDAEGSVTCWIGDLEAGGIAAAQPPVERTFLRLEGYDREEIAARLGCAGPTVTRKRDVIRQTSLEN
jgi:hypothetical protein